MELENMIKKFLKKYIEENKLEYASTNLMYAIRKAVVEGDFSDFIEEDDVRSNIENTYKNNLNEIKKDVVKQFVEKTIGSDEKIVEIGGDTYNFAGKWYSFKEVLNLYVEELIKEIDNEISNVNEYTENLNKIKAEMITGLTHNKEGSIELANMQATTSIGNHRKNQEDAVLLTTHPNNSEFKLLVVSDGMGGGEKGEEASHFMVNEINNWFENLPEEYFNDIENLQELLKEKIKLISVEIAEKHDGKSGATIVASIVGKEKTIVANSGDSRAYIIKDGKLKQVTRDDSVVQDLFENGMIEKKDDMRFHESSNEVTEMPGCGSVEPKTHIINNEDYDKLLLFSDGVTDCLSDEQILVITENSDRKNITKKLVEEALKNDSHIRPELKWDMEYNKIIKAGKDNTTAAVYERE